MNEDQFNKELASYVSFTLMNKPKVTFEGAYNENGEFIKGQESISLEDSDLLSNREFSTIEELMDKYKQLRKFLPRNDSLNNLKIEGQVDMPFSKSENIENFITVRVNAKQLAIAKQVSTKTEKIYQFYKSEEYREAKKSYNDLQDYLDKQRTAFIGDFKSTRQVEDALGTYAVGAYNDSMNHPTVGAGCFVFIEIILM